MPWIVTYPAVPVDRIPRLPDLPPALRLMLKFDFGSLPWPWLWNGPPKLSVIGDVSDEEPVGLTVRLSARLPLLTVWDPLNVCLRRLVASLLELLPQALTPSTISAASNGGHTARRPQIHSLIETSSSAWRSNRAECSIGTVRLRLFGLLVVLAAAPASATADPVIVLGSRGHWAVRDDRFLTLPSGLPIPAAPIGAPRASAAGSRRTVFSELARLYRAHAVDRSAYRGYASDWRAARATAARLRGTRAGELRGVIDNMARIAAAGELTSSRLRVLFLTVDRNRRWWTTGPLLSYGERVEFAGSELVWEEYPGQGIELQELGSFGKANGYYSAGRSQYAHLRRLLAELIPLAARRAGGLTWEYYFGFDGGVPPWTSAMSQGTALEALTRADRAFDDRYYLSIARQALPVLATSPPRGVSVRTRRGRRYLLYSFAPGAAVLNGFLQALIGLYDYAHRSGDGEARRLFRQGDAEARAEVPRYDTGTWSLYQPGQEDTLDYHKLVTGFLHELCSRTHAAVYCTTARRFDSYLKHPPF